jgi:hypothetical protein
MYSYHQRWLKVTIQTSIQRMPMPSNIRECSRSARGRDRTGMGFPPRDFLTHYSFRCCMRCTCIWSLDFTFALSRDAI